MRDERPDDHEHDQDHDHDAFVSDLDAKLVAAIDAAKRNIAALPEPERDALANALAGAMLDGLDQLRAAVEEHERTRLDG